MLQRFIWRVIAVNLGLVSTGRGADVQAQGYTLTTVGRLPAPANDNSFVKAVNNNGDVLIDSGSQPNTRAAIFASGALVNLGVPETPYNYWTNGMGLNDSGQACGNAWSKDQGYHAFLYSGGPKPTITDLGTLPGYTYSSQASAINNAGQVVGDSESSNTNGGTAHAFLYTNGAMQDMGSLPGMNTSVATGINNLGTVVGYCFAAFGPFQHEMAFISGPSGLQPLGTLPAPFNFGSEAHAINDKGDVVGTSYDSAGNSRAVLWHNGVMTDLGALPGFTAHVIANSINSSGQIMGYSSDVGGGTHYFLYSDSTMTDMNNLLYTAFPGYELSDFEHINDAGQIGAGGYGPNRVFESFLLTPVPEPTSISIVAIVASLMPRRRVPRCA